jgi:membrane protein
MEFFRDFFRGMTQKRLFLKAAALSYTTVLTILPLIAITFTVTNIVLTQADPEQIDRVLDLVLNRMVPQVELLENPIRYGPEGTIISKREIKDGIKSFIRQVGSGQVGLIGGSTFIFLAFSLLMTIEHSLNDIWNVESGRSFMTQLWLYLAIIIIGSVFLFLAIILTSHSQGSRILQGVRKIPLLPWLLQLILPFLISWLGLTFLYVVLPNVKVNLIAGLTGGVVAGTILQLNTMMSFLYLFNVATATRIYGRLGILPIFLAGLYVSWLFVLAGAQFTKSFEDYFRNTPRIY